MALPDKLYKLRKERGLSQEQLADALGISRQAISKWESAKAMPETDKLILLSEYFGVSVDYLLKDVDAIPSSGEIFRKDKVYRYVGSAFLALGILGIIYWAVLSLMSHAFADRIAYSSTITIGGNGIYIFLCVLVSGFGVRLLMKKSKEK